MMMTMRAVSRCSILLASVVYIGSSSDGYCCEAFAPIITPRHFSSAQLQLHAEQQPNNALLSDLKALQSEDESKQEAVVVSSSDYFVADEYNDGSMAAMVEELKDISSGDKKLMAPSPALKSKFLPIGSDWTVLFRLISLTPAPLEMLTFS